MKAELKQKWTEALRSGKYQQGTRFLRSADNHYCCLGVLRAVAGLPWGPVGDGVYEGDLGHVGALSPTEQAELGLGCRQTHLMDMNDQDRLPFEKIADWIERHVPTDPQ
jgi:hypothetical protein